MNPLSFTQGTVDDIHMTCLQGEVFTTRRKIQEAFGEPTSTETSGDGKVTTEWILVFDDGEVATIYDWKRYDLGAPEMDEVEDWHIGGKSHEVVNRVLELLGV